MWEDRRGEEEVVRMEEGETESRARALSSECRREMVLGESRLSSDRDLHLDLKILIRLYIYRVFTKRVLLIGC